jgi:hypothetical protein
MGTGSTIKFQDIYGVILVCFYQQFDGYLSKLGLELAEFCLSRTLCSGIVFGPVGRVIISWHPLLGQIQEKIKIR